MLPLPRPTPGAVTWHQRFHDQFRDETSESPTPRYHSVRGDPPTVPARRQITPDRRWSTSATRTSSSSCGPAPASSAAPTGPPRPSGYIVTPHIQDWVAIYLERQIPGVGLSGTLALPRNRPKIVSLYFLYESVFSVRPSGSLFLSNLSPPSATGPQFTTLLHARTHQDISNTLICTCFLSFFNGFGFGS